jgi:histidine phosphotransfer protein HptB
LLDEPEECLIDFEYLAKLTLGDKDFEKQLLETFMEDATLRVEQLKQAIATSDVPAIKNYAHQLKGISGMVAIEKIANISRQIEYQADTNSLNGLDQLWTELNQILELVKEIKF